MKLSFLISLYLWVFICCSKAQTFRGLNYYQEKARENNPALQQNKNSQRILVYQNELFKNQNKKPQIYLNTDLLLTPAFFDGAKFISFTNSYETRPLGYDGNVTAHTLYAAQVNVSKSILNKGIIQPVLSQNATLNQSIELENRQLIHDIDRNISDQYIGICQIQDEIAYIQRMIEKIEGRKNIVEELAKKGIMAESDYLQLRMILIDQQNNIELLKIQQLSAFGQLNAICNIDDTTIYTFEKPILSLSQPVKDLQLMLKYEVDSTFSVLQQKSNETKYLPQLTLFGNGGYYSATISTLYRNIGVSAGLRLTVPIYDGNQKSNIAQQYHIEKQNLKIAKDFNLQQLRSNLKNLIQQIKASERSIVLMDEQLNSHDLLLNVLKDKIILGQASVTDYILSLEEYAATFHKKVKGESSLLLLINQYNYLNW